MQHCWTVTDVCLLTSQVLYYTYISFLRVLHFPWSSSSPSMVSTTLTSMFFNCCTTWQPSENPPLTPSFPEGFPQRLPTFSRFSLAWLPSQSAETVITSSASLYCFSEWEPLFPEFLVSFPCSLSQKYIPRDLRNRKRYMGGDLAVECLKRSLLYTLFGRIKKSM